MSSLAASPVSDRSTAFVLLRDIEDLHDADLDLVLADRLAESADALRAAVTVTVAELAAQVAQPAALGAHLLGPAARRLA